MQTGKLSINSDNIFPIIKKWLYHDKDIFIRELISNSSDAITKLKKLSDIGETTLNDDNFEINIILNKDTQTIKFCDNGIGMTEEEVDKYINQIAFSGAKEFMESHSKDNEDNSIIGHFGLGFYSCFMASAKVEIDTLSYKNDAEAVHWECSGDTEYKISKSEKNERGTVITLYINDEGKEFLENSRIQHVMEHYCSYMPFPIYLYEEGKEENKVKINEIQPLWMKDPKECTDDEYATFYHTNFNDVKNPLFWIHLNMDYPIKLRGVLYFPQFNHDYELNEGQVKLYCNQVYVADNIKEVIPDFLLVLKGAIDCPELPLNVSRSFLQSDDYVKKISSYIIKKVADKLSQERKSDKEKYEKLWEALGTFVKFGCIRNDSFYDKVKDNIIYKTINMNYVTMDEYVENLGTEEYQKKIYYTSNPAKEAKYIQMFKENNQNAIVLNSGIDTHYIAFLEQKENTLKFERIDSSITDSAIDTTDMPKEKLEEITNNLKEIFNTCVENSKNFKIQAQNLKSKDIAGLILVPENSRRMEELFKIYGSANPFGATPIEKTLVLNYNNNLVQFLNNNKDNMINDKDKITLICNQLYDLARIGNEGLNEEEMNNFITRSQDIMNMMIK